MVRLTRQFVVHGQGGAPVHAFLVDRLSKRAEITGFRTSMIFQQVGNSTPTSLPS